MNPIMPDTNALLDDLLGVSSADVVPDMSFIDFKHAVFRGYEQAAHLSLIDTLLTSVTRHAETRGREGTQFAVIDALIR